MQASQAMGGLGGSMGDDDALESFLDSYLTNSFGAPGNNAFGMGQQQPQQQQQQGTQQLLGAGLAGQPSLNASLLSLPGSLGLNQPQIPGPGQGLGNMGLAGGEDTSNMSITALQALLRQRQLNQQQTGFNGIAPIQYGNLGGMGGGSLLRPTSLQDHLNGGISSEHSAWRPSLGTLPSTTGMNYGASHGVQFGEPMGGFHEASFPNPMAPAPIMRPASDSLLVNQKSVMRTPIGLQVHGLSSLRTNSFSAQTAAAAGIIAGGMKKSTWDATPLPVAEGSDDSSEDDSSQRRRVRGRSASTAHQPSVQQEKNRSAQRRFRQRQKEKMSYLESRTDVLTVQVDKLTQENDSLRNMNTMLEKVLNLREEHISNLQEAAKVFGNLNLRGSSEPDGSGDAAGGDAALKAMQDAVAAAAGGGAAAALGSGAGGGGVLGGANSIKSEDGPSSGGGSMTDTAMASSPMGLLASGGGHVLPQNMDGATARFTAEAIRSMTADDVIDAWKENLKELSRYVVLAENSPPGQPMPPSVVSRITSVTASMSELVHKVAMISPLNVKRLLATNMELHAMVPVPEPHWSRVLLVLGLTERQRKDLLGARERFLAKFEAVVQERSALINGLSQQAIPRARVFAEICSSSLAAHEAADRLRSNLQREHNINMEFVVFVFKGVLDLLQIAKASVHSYPYYPDVLAMANVLSAQQSQQSSQQQQPSQQQQQQMMMMGGSSTQLQQQQLQQQQLQQQLQQQQLQQQQLQQQQLQQQQLQQQQQQAIAMGGLRTTGSAPVGAAVLFGARVTSAASIGTTGSGSAANGDSGGMSGFLGLGAGMSGMPSMGMGMGMGMCMGGGGMGGMNAASVAGSGMPLMGLQQDSKMSDG